MRRRDINAVVAILLAATALAGLSCLGAGQGTRAAAEYGTLDLTGWDPVQGGPIALDGSWALYWEQVLPPDTLAGPGAPAPDGTLVLPGTWDDLLVDGEPVGGHGYATLFLTVEHDLPEGTPLALRFGDMSTAWSLFVDGRPVGNAGVVGRERASSIARYDPQVVSFPSRGGTTELVLQMSNYHHEKGGPWNSIWLGDEVEIRRDKARSQGTDMLLFGAILLMGLYHLALYLLRRKDPAPLFFGLACLAMAVRGLMVSEVFYTDLFPGANWEIQVKIEYTSTYLIIPLFLAYVRSVFPDEIPSWLGRGVWILHAALILVVLVTTGYLFTHTIIVFRLTAVIIGGYSLYALVLASLRRREGAWFVLLGFVAFFATGINDMLHTAQVIQTGYFLSVGMLAFLLSQAFLLSLRFSTAFRSVARLSERLQAADRVKDEFLARTSHELRTPLNGIHGLAETMLEGVAGPISEPQRENLEFIAHSGRRLAYLVNDILDFSRLRNEDVQLNRRDLDLRAVLAVVLPLHRHAADAKGIEIVQAIVDSIPPVYADQQRLEQILHNLVGNAIKFTDRGSVTVAASAHEGQVEISVADTGVGIPEEGLDDIFRDFEQLEAAGNRRHGGTGLGLSITRRLVQLHDGEIQVASKAGDGSIFRFTLPIAAEVLTDAAVAIGLEEPHDEFVSEARAAVSGALYLRDSEACGEAYGEAYGEALIGEGFPTLEQYLELDPSRPRYRILIVDDDPVSLRVAVQHLAGDEYLVLPATSGAEALVLIRQRQIDLVILDLMMPRMSGYEVCRRIRETHPASELPVIILTARDRLNDVVQGFDVGANDYLTKPFSRAELLARVRLHLSVVLANVDPLTGISNRRSFDNLLELEYRRALRHGTELSLVMIDVDHFASFNEHHGRRAGDDCLRRVASTLCGAVHRAGETVSRYDGEQFAAILPGITTDGAGIIAERIRDRVSELEIPHKGAEIHQVVTISAGFATVVPDAETDPTLLVERAVGAMQRAKKLGRDRVVGA